MATANPLEDEISCSVCFETYADPHLLIGCLHTFCLTCIQKLQRDGWINCPECREVTNIKDIRKDFKIQRIIDALTKLPPDKDHEKVGSSICGMCNNADNHVKFHCEECKHYMCDGCNMAHKRMIVCKSHTVKPVTAMAKAAEKRILNSIEKMEEQKGNAEKKFQECDRNIEAIIQANNQQLQALRQYTEETINSLKEHEKKLEEMINNSNSSLIQNLTEWKGICKTNCDEMKAKMDSLNDVITTNDLNTLLDTAQNTGEITKKDIEHSQASLGNINPSLISSVFVKKCETWNAKGYIDLKLILCASLSLSKIHENKYTLTHSCPLDFNPRKLCKIGKVIWAAGDDHKIGVVTEDGTLVKTITHDKMKDVFGITWTNNNQIIVSCKSGLHQLDENSQYMKQIKEGNFSDVCCFDGVLYALEVNTCKLLTFKYNNNWMVMNERALYNNGSACDRVLVSANSIYISSWNNHCVYKFNAQYELLKESKQKSKNICVCVMDADENFIITDYYSEQVILYTQTGNQHNVSLPGLTHRPLHALIEDDGSLWVACHEDKKIVKYSVN